MLCYGYDWKNICMMEKHVYYNTNMIIVFSV